MLSRHREVPECLCVRLFMCETEFNGKRCILGCGCRMLLSCTCLLASGISFQFFGMDAIRSQRKDFRWHAAMPCAHIEIHWFSGID